MTKKIFVIGLDNTKRDIIINMTLKGSRKELPKLTHVKLPKMSGIASLKDTAEKRGEFSHKFSKLMSAKKNLIVSGSLVAKTPLGTVPLLEDLSDLKADLIVLLESDTREMFAVPGYGIADRKDKEALNETRLMQELNRQFAAHSGSPLVILNIERENIKKALKELRKVLVTVMK